VVGDTAWGIKEKKNRIDLVDEWSDITELPYVHGIWAARDGNLTIAEMNSIIESARQGVKHLEHLTSEINRSFFEHFQYDLDDKTLSGLSEFFHMAYCHGILKDIPDVKLHTLNETPSPSTISPN